VGRGRIAALPARQHRRQRDAANKIRFDVAAVWRITRASSTAEPLIYQTVDARHGHDVDVAGRHGFEHPQQLAPVGLRSTCLFAIDFDAFHGAELVKLRIEYLREHPDITAMTGRKKSHFFQRLKAIEKERLFPAGS